MGVRLRGDDAQKAWYNGNMKKANSLRKPLSERKILLCMSGVCSQSAEASRNIATSLANFVSTKIVQPVVQRTTRRYNAIRKDSRTAQKRRLLQLAQTLISQTNKLLYSKLQVSLPNYTLSYLYIYSSPVNLQ
jgi:hypothetical protein